jgi:hypothetical protein
MVCLMYRCTVHIEGAGRWLQLLVILQPLERQHAAACCLICGIRQASAACIIARYVHCTGTWQVHAHYYTIAADFGSSPLGRLNAWHF